jgi:hypothetical protein
MSKRIKHSLINPSPQSLALLAVITERKQLKLPEATPMKPAELRERQEESLAQPSGEVRAPLYATVMQDKKTKLLQKAKKTKDAATSYKVNKEDPELWVGLIAKQVLKSLRNKESAQINWHSLAFEISPILPLSPTQCREIFLATLKNVSSRSSHLQSLSNTSSSETIGAHLLDSDVFPREKPQRKRRASTGDIQNDNSGYSNQKRLIGITHLSSANGEEIPDNKAKIALNGDIGVGIAAYLSECLIVNNELIHHNSLILKELVAALQNRSAFLQDSRRNKRFKKAL